MGRRKSRPRRPAAAADSSDDELFRPELDQEEMQDELDQFEAERERELLAAGGGGGGGPAGSGRRPPAEVLAFADDDSASDAEFDQTPLGAPEQEQTIEAAAGGWGKRKASYYSTDHVDEDWRGATRQETLEAAELEEREARTIQRRLAEQIEADELSFGAETVRPTAAAAAAETETVALDSAGLSRPEREALLRRRHPELLPLMEQFRSRWSELSTSIEPAYRLLQLGRLAAGPGARYVSVRRRLLLLYCLNISHYLSRRAQRRPTDAHPVMRRLAQLGRLLETLAPADRLMAPQLRALAADPPPGEPGTAPAAIPGGAPGAAPAAAPASRKLKVAKRRPAAAAVTASSAVGRQLAALTMEIDTLEREKRRIAAEKAAAGASFTELRRAGQARHNPLAPFRRRDRPADTLQAGAEDVPAADSAGGTADPESGQKRSITHQMAKNKGLMPKRSRESRNPRVKHKEKFKRAVKKRRSLVRQPKKELKKYGGEVFGIRMGAVKSVAIK